MKNILSKYSHISFDLDGTLVHTIPAYRHKIVPMVVRKLSGTILNSHSVDKFWFEGVRDKTIQEDFNLKPDIFWDSFREIDTPEARSAHTFAYPDAERALIKLKDMGKTISIITGAPHWIAAMEIEKLNGAPHDFYLSLNDVKFGEKPDPAGFLYVLENLKKKPKDTVYIGNSSEDAYFAQKAGADFIYLERKEHEFSLEKEAIATIQSLDELF